MPESNYSERFDEISYEKGWQRVSNPTPAVRITPKNAGAEAEDYEREEQTNGRAERNKRRKPRFLLLTLQLVLCALILIAVVVFKQTGTAEYDRFKAEYDKRLNDMIFETAEEKVLDLDKIFPSETVSSLPSQESEAEQASSEELGTQADTDAQP